MSFRIFNSVDLVVVIDTTTWEVQKFPLDNIWYQYTATEAPIIYSVYQINPERKLVLDHPYTEFQDVDGCSFSDDIALQAYLDEILGKKEVSPEYTTRGNDKYLKTSDQSNNTLLCDILKEIKQMNIQLSLITGDEIRRT